MLPQWVSSCRIDDYVVFLDARRNRYLALGHAAAAPLLAGDVAGLSPRIREKIRKFGWLATAPQAMPTRVAGPLPVIEPPRRELPVIRAEAVPLSLAARVAGALVKTRIDLATRSFQGNLDRVAARNRSTSASAGPCDMTGTIAAFSRGERMLAAQTCLLRSLALHRLLARDGHASTLVFGVKLHPFEAHCWLQHGDAVLNDTVEQVGLFVPIRSIA
jgi:hypothetical protein